VVERPAEAKICGRKVRAFEVGMNVSGSFAALRMTAKTKIEQLRSGWQREQRQGQKPMRVGLARRAGAGWRLVEKRLAGLDEDLME
jgi:hypothetical protein